MYHEGNAGIKLSYDKGIIKSKCCSFFSNLYNPGVRPEPEKVKVINEMQPPINKLHMLQWSSFLNMVTYLSSYIPIF